MSLLETLHVAASALLRNKLRSFLTALGVIIGVGAVIAMVAIGEGAKARVEESFASMGSNLLVVLSGSANAGGAHGGFGSLPTLTWGDLKAIQSEASAVRRAAPQIRTQAQLLSEELNWTTGVTGTTPDFFAIRNWSLSSGELFSQSDIDGGNKVVVLGQTVVDNLFGTSADPVGQMVRINNIPFQVVGVLTRKGQSPIGQDYDDAAFVPTSTYLAKLQGSVLGNFIPGGIIVGTTSPEEADRAESQVANLLRDRHRIGPGQEDDFSIRNLAEMANALQEGTQVLTTLLASIAAVSLFVGGIGIMNIMLVSVTERTREIGLRMAVGAKSNHILAQFLVEALTLSLAGGIIGVGAGLLTAQWLATQFSWPTKIRSDIVLIAMSFSGLVGVAFGLYPARKASRLDPIDALRYE